MEICKIKYAPEYDAILSRAIPCPADLRAVVAQIEKGEANLFCIVDVGLIVTRVEGDEIVIVAGVGKNFRAVVKSFQRFADMTHKTVRIHTIKRGVERWLDNLGFAFCGFDCDDYSIYKYRG